MGVTPVQPSSAFWFSQQLAREAQYLAHLHRPFSSDEHQQWLYGLLKSLHEFDDQLRAEAR